MMTNAAGEPTALVTNIQKYTIHDGPGIRTEIFFKGCNMRCIWCSNPESLSALPQLGVYPAKCLGRQKCGRCAGACPQAGSPIRFDADGVIKSIDFAEYCEGCLRCAQACPAGAVKIWGTSMTVPELMKIILEDKAYYERSGGGVTLSGGEVLLSAEFAELLLKECKKEGVGTCVESALNVPWERAQAVLRLTDLLITDIKHMNAEKHREYTGSGNERILRNIKKAAEFGVKILLRTPVVPGFNDDDENMRATGAYIRDELGGAVIQYQLLPYRKMGTEKYASLCMEYPIGDRAVVPRGEWENKIAELAAMLTDEFGIPAAAGSGNKLPL